MLEIKEEKIKSPSYYQQFKDKIFPKLLTL